MNITVLDISYLQISKVAITRSTHRPFSFINEFLFVLHASRLEQRHPLQELEQRKNSDDTFKRHTLFFFNKNKVYKNIEAENGKILRIC